MAHGDLVRYTNKTVHTGRQFFYSSQKYLKPHGGNAYFLELANMFETMADKGIKETFIDGEQSEVALTPKEISALRREAYLYRVFSNPRVRKAAEQVKKEHQQAVKFLGITDK